MKNRLYFAFFSLAFFAVFITLPGDAFAQEKIDRTGISEYKKSGFCENNYSSYKNRVGFSELRELKLTSTGRLEVDGGKNGGISVVGGDVADVTVRACVNTWGTSEAEAQSIAQNISILTSGVIKAENPSTDDKWGVSFQITVPRRHDLDLTAKNGGISISGVDGSIKFTTVNGGISLKEVAGDVLGRTTNGGVTVKLDGSSWRGSGLDVATTNGGVKLMLPENYSANVETGTVNGGYKSAFPSLQADRGERWKPVRVSAPINGGGAPVRVITTNGGVTIDHF